jgi:hypothetical protein
MSNIIISSFVISQNKKKFRVEYIFNFPSLYTNRIENESPNKTLLW